MAQSDVFHLEGGSRFEGRRYGDSQQMKCAEHKGEDLAEDTETSMFSFRSECSKAQSYTVPHNPSACGRLDGHRAVENVAGPSRRTGAFALLLANGHQPPRSNLRTILNAEIPTQIGGRLISNPI